MARHSFLSLLLASLTLVPTSSAQESGKLIVEARDQGAAVADGYLSVCFLTSSLIVEVVPATTPSLSSGGGSGSGGNGGSGGISTAGTITTAIGLSSALSTSVPPTLTILTTGTASSFPAIKSYPNSTTSLTSAASNPTEISVPGATYVYKGCFQAPYVQPVTADYVVGSISQCATSCLGSDYFQLEAGDDCGWLRNPGKKARTDKSARHVRR